MSYHYLYFLLFVCAALILAHGKWRQQFQALYFTPDTKVLWIKSSKISSAAIMEKNDNSKKRFIDVFSKNLQFF